MNSGTFEKQGAALLRFAASNQPCAAWLAAAHAAFPVPPPNVPGVEFRDAITWLAYTGIVPIAALRAPVADGRRKRARTVAVPSVEPQRIGVVDTGVRRVIYYDMLNGVDEAARARVVVWIAPTSADDNIYFTTPIGAAFHAQEAADARFGPALNTFLAHGNAPALLLPDGARAASEAAVPLAQMFAARGESPARGTRVPAAHVPISTVHTQLHGGITARLLMEALSEPRRRVAQFNDGDAEGMAAALSALFSEVSGRKVVVTPVLRGQVAPAGAPTPRGRRREASEESDADSDRDEERDV